MKIHAALSATLLLGLSASLLSQSDARAKKPSFEVASIKPNKDAGGGSWSSSGGRQTIIGTTAKVLIMSAFNLHDYEIIGAPSWSDSERLDVVAQAEGTPTPEESRLMMQSLLEERFALKAHRETREAPVYRLILAKKDGMLGPQLLKSDSECGDKPPASVPWALNACNMRMGPADIVDRRIVDETRLSGRFARHPIDLRGVFASWR